jgi:hypothetical protein
VNALRAVVAALSVLVVGLLAAFVVAASGQSSDNSARVGDIAVLRSQVHQAKAAAKAAEAKAQSSGQAEVSDLKRRLGHAERRDGLPEVQTELNSLEIDRHSLFISPSSQVSRVCQAVVYPSSGGE